MPLLDAHKEDIAFEKQVFYILLAAGLANVGWIFTHLRDVGTDLLLLAGSAVIADGIALAFLGWRVKNKIREVARL